MLDQQPPDPSALNAGLDEQGIEFGVAVLARQDR